MTNSNIKNIKKITGTGLVFPIKLENGKPELQSGWELIKSSLRNIFAYEYGEKFFLYEFGLKLRQILEDPVDEITYSTLDYQFDVILPNWERRIKIDSVKLIPNKDRGKIDVQCRISMVNSQQSETFIFPYYTEIKY